MMYSMEKCLGRNGTGTPEEAELFAGEDEVLGRDGAPEEDAALASAVAAVSHEIGDILKDELGTTNCADRLGIELADRLGVELNDLGAELGLLASLAEPGTKHDFPALLKLAMNSRECESSDSSSSWSRRAPRPARHPRRRPIAKGKEVSRRLGACARRVGARSEVSDEGADEDSDDQWTELDGSATPSASGSSSSDTSSTSNAGVDLDDYRAPEIPQLRQFLLPLISNVPNSVQFRIRHDDIVQFRMQNADMVKLLATEEDEPSLADMPALRDLVMNDDLDELSSEEELLPFEEQPVTTEEEAELLHYVCGGPRETATFEPTEEWLLGMFHSWCEVSALIYTLIGTDASARRVLGPWAYRARAGCHCRLCVSLARAAPALAALLRSLVWTLAHGGATAAAAAGLVRALALAPAALAPAALRPARWDLRRLRRLHFSDDGVEIIHNHLVRCSQQNETARQIITLVCCCRGFDKPMEKEYAVERLIRILECYKAASIVKFKVDIVPLTSDPDTCHWVASSRDKLRRYLLQYHESPTSPRIQLMAARYQPSRTSVWEGYVHSCECLTPKILCAQQRKLLLRSIYSRMSAFGAPPGEGDDDLPVGPTPIPSQRVLYSILKAKQTEPCDELQQGDGTGAKPPDSSSARACDDEPAQEPSDGESDANAELDDSSFLTVSESESGSLSSLDSASELLLAAAHALDHAEPAPAQLCRTVRHLMRSIASIERHMDTVLKQCDQWPAAGGDVEARKQVDMGLSAVDRKLMAVYRRLPLVHRRQLQVYRKQKKLSTVCGALVGGPAPAPPAPPSPPPAPRSAPDHTLCPEYHLQRFKEVRRKVMHMRDQQLYYHRLRMWLEDQLRQERESVGDGNVSLLGELQRRKRRTSSPRQPRLPTAAKRKLKPTAISKPHRILQLLKHKYSHAAARDHSDADTVVGEREDMSHVIATLAQIALNPDKRMQQVIAELREDYGNAKPTSTDSEESGEYPDSVSPPLQQMSPTTSDPTPVYPPKPTQRLINKFTDKIDFNAQIAPLNARKSPENAENTVTVYKDPKIYKYVTFGLEIKKAMEECQNIINSYNSIKTEKDKDSDDGPLSLEQICEVMMSLDKNSAEFLTNTEESDVNAANSKLAELVENMPQILANMPEIATEFANASFELPEFASIMNNLPDVSETQLTPETLKQIRDLKITKRDNVKVTKNTAKRKISRKIKSNIDSDIIGTLTFEFDSKDLADLIKDEKELQALMKCKTQNKEEFKDLLFSISAQVVINKVFDYMKASTNPELTKYINDEIFALPKSNINAEIYAKAVALFDNSVKDSLSMDELRANVRARFTTWKTYVTNEFKNISMALLDTEVEGMLDKFYLYIKDLARKQGVCEREKIIEKLEEKKEQACVTSEECSPPKESLKQITKILSVSVGNTFDLLLMQMSRMTGEKRAALKNMRIKYVDVLKRCAESQQLATWILSDPDLAASHIQELMGFGANRTQEKLPDFHTMPVEKKRAYFIDRLRSINRHFMDNIPRHNVTGDEWLVMLYRLEQFENKIMDTLVKFSPVAKTTQSVSEAEILAAKGLSKIIGKASNIRVVKKDVPAIASVTASKTNSPIKTPNSPAKTIETANPTQSIPIPLPASESPKDTRRDVITKCENLIAQKGNKALKENFDAIKSYLAGEVPKPDSYHDHVMAIVTNLDYSSLDDEMVEVLQFGGITISPPAPTTESTSDVNLPAHNQEDLAKYSAQALRNAKQTLNAVAFKNLSRNGQSKSESDISSCDVPSSECKYTSDCVCTACKRDRSICLGDIVKISFDPSNPEKSKAMLEERRKEKEKEKIKTVVKAKPVPKQCENSTHQQHVCKVGHTNNGNGSCTGDGGDQHCTCCYCTVFGHAPPLTTPVPRNFNETRERLRSILNKKKQLCKTSNGSPAPESKSPAARASPAPSAAPAMKLAQPQPKPPALPKTLPPNLTAQAQAKRQALDSQQRMLADKMAKMVVTEKPEALQRTAPVQMSVPPSLKAEGKVNASAMEQIRLQQLKQAQLSQKKPEPIYDLPIHNKPPQQQHIIRQELQKQQLQKHLLLQQKLKQNPVVSIPPQTPTQNPPQAPLVVPQVQQVQQVQPQVQIQQKPVQQIQQIPVPVQPQVQTTQQQIPPKPVQQNQPKPFQQVPPQPAQVQQKPVQQVPQKPVAQVQQKPVLAQQVPQKPQVQQPQIQKTPQPVNRVTPQTAQPQKPVQPQLLQKPPIQQAPRKPPPQELQQKLAQKQQQPIQKPVQPVAKPQLTPQQLQQQQLQQQQLRQQQLQQQQLQQQRQSRQPNQNSVSLSSRDTSVFSTSSGCSDGSCWRGRSEDTRDLDALLQYIQGPARHVDRHKKRAKKLRQKAKKTEERLTAECAKLKIEYARVRFEAEALRVAHNSAKRRCDDTRKSLQLMTANTSSKNRKKQNKLTPTQKQQMEALAEQVGELTALKNTTAKELQTAEAEMAECAQKLRKCEKEINEARYIQGKKTPVKMSAEDTKKSHSDQEEEQEKVKQEEAQRLRNSAQWQQQQQLQQQQLQQQQLQQQQLQQHRRQQQMQLQQRQMQMEQEMVNQTRSDEAKLLKQRQNEAIANAKQMGDDAKRQKSDAKKQTQTWEQALAHINQVAKGNKEKKKKQPAAPVKPEPKPKENIVEEPPPLSKKQRKKLAQQMAEEEERQQQEALEKKKRREPASPDPKAEPLTKKAEKKLEQAKRAEEAKTKKEAKRERKLEKKEEKKKEEKKAKEKENNQEKNAQTPKQVKQPTPPPALTKKERRREQQLLQQKQQEAKPQVVNITPHTTIEIVNKKNASAVEPEKPASCSIMEQLSSGIQVSELRLPPGITLTRVQPHEKKDPPAIKSVPLWKARELGAAPTPPARPQPVIAADPALMMFSATHPEPPKPIIVAEPAPTGKSKKSKKKAKKSTTEEPKPEGTKMVTLRNPMFHPNLPPVQVTNNSPPVSNPKKPEIRLPDPIPMPPNACQATITPTSNGMYTIRNPLMSMMHQQNIRNPTPPFNQYKYANPKFNNEAKTDDYNNRIMNLASFTQKNDEGYSLFSTPENVHKSFLSPEYFGEDPKPVVSPNPIGTRPEVSRTEESLFTNIPEPIGTPKREENDYTGLYTPFGVENPNLFRNALFSEEVNGDLPYFQRLRVGSKLNNEVTIHHVTESKFYRQEPDVPLEAPSSDASLFSRAWPETLYAPAPPPTGGAGAGGEPHYGAVGTRPSHEGNIYVPETPGAKLSPLEACEREMESFKRYEWYFTPEPTTVHSDLNTNK